MSKTRLRLKVTKCRLDGRNFFLDLLVLLSNDGEGFYFTAIGLVYKEAEIFADKITVVDPNNVAMIGKASLRHIPLITVDCEEGTRVVWWDAPGF
ncbi:hypothetical protein D3C72_1962510 [compost metagenome]